MLENLFSPIAMVFQLSFSVTGQEHHHLHHPHLEASLSHVGGDSNPSSNKHQSHFFSRQHATITSNSAASLEMAAASQLQVPIKGKKYPFLMKKYIQFVKFYKNCLYESRFNFSKRFYNHIFKIIFEYFWNNNSLIIISML